VRTHPEFKLVVDAQGRVQSSTANLAVLVLKEAVTVELQHVELPDSEVQLNEPVTAVSYGYDEIIGGKFGERRFIKVQVTKDLGPGGRMLFGPSGSKAYKGESGGAVLREGEQSPVLMGILSRSLGEEPSFTSIYAYRAWLRDELQQAARTAPVRPDRIP
jgi:hypothetical protein